MDVDTTKADETILWLAKVGAMIVLGMGSIISGSIPMIVKKWRAKPEKEEEKKAEPKPSVCMGHSHTASHGIWTSFLLCFGGGVLLATCFVHLLIEVRHTMEHDLKEAFGDFLNDVPVTEILFVLGFFLVYLLEEGVHIWISHSEDATPENALHRTMSVRCSKRAEDPCKPCQPPCNGTTSPTEETPMRTSLASSTVCCDPPKEDYLVNSPSPTPTEDKCTPLIDTVAIDVTEPSKTDSKYDGNSQDQLINPEKDSHTSSLTRGIIMIFALSVHAVFEGLVVGLEPKLESVLSLAGAIATHKFVIAFTVGMQLSVYGLSSKKIIINLLVFALVTPIGILLGMLPAFFGHSSPSVGLGGTVVEALAGGTLLYVVFLEILAREIATKQNGLMQFMGAFLGFTLMTAITLSMPHSHDHEDHEHHDHDH